MLRMIFLSLLPACLIACGELGRLTGPEEEPEEPEPIVAESDTIRVTLPERVVDDPVEEGPAEPEEPPEPEALSPEAARQALVDQGILYNQASFIKAAEEGNLEVVQWFIWAGMDPNVQPYTASPVYVSLRDNPTRFAHLRSSWFPQGADDDDTALMKAAYGGHLDVVQFLMEHGADGRIRNSRKQQVMHFAAAGGHLDVVEYLADTGGRQGLYDLYDPFSYDPIVNGPRTPLHWAALGGHMDVVEYIYHYIKRNNRGRGAGDGIVFAAIGGHVEIIAWYVENHIVINRGRTQGYVLAMASYFGHAEAVGYLLSQEADLHFRFSRWIGLNTPEGVLYYEDVGFGPLHAAIQAGHVDILHALLESWLLRFGADGRDEHGMTGLHYAAAGGDVAMVRAFLDNGCPVNAQSDIGVTPLMFGAEWGHVGVVEMLLAEGADPSLVSAYDDTAKVLAEENGHESIVALLQN